MQAAFNGKRSVAFSPTLYFRNVADAIRFYQGAFDAKELRRWSNDDGSVHVAELVIEDAHFICMKKF